MKLIVNEMCDKGECNYVAKAQNWDQRVKGEIESAKIWDTHWGELYAKNMPRDYEGKVQKLQEEIDKLPTVRMMSLSQMSFKPVRPYDEWHDFKRRSRSQTEKEEVDA